MRLFSAGGIEQSWTTGQCLVLMTVIIIVDHPPLNHTQIKVELLSAWIPEPRTAATMLILDEWHEIGIHLEEFVVVVLISNTDQLLW